MITDYHNAWNHFETTDKEKELLNTLIDLYSISSTFTVRETNEKGFEFTDRLFNNINSKAFLDKKGKNFTFNKNKILPILISYGEYYNEQEKNLTKAVSKRFNTKTTIIISALIALIGIFIINIFSLIFAAIFLYYYLNKTNSLKKDLDTVHTYQNRLGKFLEVKIT